MTWRLAKSLIILREQIDEAYPQRSKSSDGTKGNSAHAKSKSDHNPNRENVVCALDLTNHPGYFDAHALADHLIKFRHPNLKYVISNSRIASAKTGWKWVRYTGTNPHNKHIHISVGIGPDGSSVRPYDSPQKWDINKKKGNTMSADALTEYEVKELFRAYFGTKSVPPYNFQHKGQPLANLIKQFRAHPMALMNEESLGLIGPIKTETPDQEKEKLYNELTIALKKAFGK